MQISIHAPARGATAGGRRLPHRGYHFNPRTREGCDSSIHNPRPLPPLFQSTHPRGVRQAGQSRPRNYNHYFNPRTREGCDRPKGRCRLMSLSFQSTHPRGVRLRCVWRWRSGISISIHAPARGATCHERFFETATSHFNPRTREGCDVRLERGMLSQDNFNPRTREGCDPEMLKCGSRICGFQSTHPRGVRLEDQ